MECPKSAASPDFTKICFLCIQERNNLNIASHETIGQNASILEHLKCLLPEMLYLRNLPINLCNPCLISLTASYTFKKRCLANNYVLIKYIKTATEKGLILQNGKFVNRQHNPPQSGPNSRNLNQQNDPGTETNIRIRGAEEVDKELSRRSTQQGTWPFLKTGDKMCYQKFIQEKNNKLAVFHGTKKQFRPNNNQINLRHSNFAGPTNNQQTQNKNVVIDLTDEPRTITVPSDESTTSSNDVTIQEQPQNESPVTELLFGDVPEVKEESYCPRRSDEPIKELLFDTIINCDEESNSGDETKITEKSISPKIKFDQIIPETHPRITLEELNIKIEEPESEEINFVEDTIDIKEHQIDDFTDSESKLHQLLLDDDKNKLNSEEINHPTLKCLLQSNDDLNNQKTSNNQQITHNNQNNPEKYENNQKNNERNQPTQQQDEQANSLSKKRKLDLIPYVLLEDCLAGKGKQFTSKQSKNNKRTRKARKSYAELSDDELSDEKNDDSDVHSSDFESTNESSTPESDEEPYSLHSDHKIRQLRSNKVRKTLKKLITYRKKPPPPPYHAKHIIKSTIVANSPDYNNSAHQITICNNPATNFISASNFDAATSNNATNFTNLSNPNVATTGALNYTNMSNYNITYIPETSNFDATTNNTANFNNPSNFYDAATHNNIATSNNARNFINQSTFNASNSHIASNFDAINPPNIAAVGNNPSTSNYDARKNNNNVPIRNVTNSAFKYNPVVKNASNSNLLNSHNNVAASGAPNFTYTSNYNPATTNFNAVTNYNNAAIPNNPSNYINSSNFDANNLISNNPATLNYSSATNYNNVPIRNRVATPKPSNTAVSNDPSRKNSTNTTNYNNNATSNYNAATNYNHVRTYSNVAALNNATNSNNTSNHNGTPPSFTNIRYNAATSNNRAHMNNPSNSVINFANTSNPNFRAIGYNPATSNFDAASNYNNVPIRNIVGTSNNATNLTNTSNSNVPAIRNSPVTSNLTASNYNNATVHNNVVTSNNPPNFNNSLSSATNFANTSNSNVAAIRNSPVASNFDAAANFNTVSDRYNVAISDNATNFNNPSNYNVAGIRHSPVASNIDAAVNYNNVPSRYNIATSNNATNFNNPSNFNVTAVGNNPRTNYNNVPIRNSVGTPNNTTNITNPPRNAANFANNSNSNVSTVRNSPIASNFDAATNYNNVPIRNSVGTQNNTTNISSPSSKATNFVNTSNSNVAAIRNSPVASNSDVAAKFNNVPNRYKVATSNDATNFNNPSNSNIATSNFDAATNYNNVGTPNITNPLNNATNFANTSNSNVAAIRNSPVTSILDSAVNYHNITSNRAPNVVNSSNFNHSTIIDNPATSNFNAGSNSNNVATGKYSAVPDNATDSSNVDAATNYRNVATPDIMSHINNLIAKNVAVCNNAPLYNNATYPNTNPENPVYYYRGHPVRHSDNVENTNNAANSYESNITYVVNTALDNPTLVNNSTVGNVGTNSANFQTGNENSNNSAGFVELSKYNTRNTNNVGIVRPTTVYNTGPSIKIKSPAVINQDIDKTIVNKNSINNESPGNQIFDDLKSGNNDDVNKSAPTNNVDNVGTTNEIINKTVDSDDTIKIMTSSNKNSVKSKIVDKVDVVKDNFSPISIGDESASDSFIDGDSNDGSIDCYDDFNDIDDFVDSIDVVDNKLDEFIDSTSKIVGIDKIVKNNDGIVENIDGTVGNHDKIVENCNKIVGNQNKSLGNDEKTGINVEIVGNTGTIIENTVSTNGKNVGNDDEIAGNDDGIVGNDDKIVGNNEKMVGNDNIIVGNDDKIVGNDSIVENTAAILGTNQGIVGNSDDTTIGNLENIGGTRGNDYDIVGNNDGRIYISDAGAGIVQNDSSSMHILKCPFPDCNTELPRMSMYYHKLAHGGFFCPDTNCNRVFPDKINLRRHMGKYHIKLRGHFICEKCNGVYRYRKFYEAHLKLHENKAEKCYTCKKQFTNAFSLKIHNKFHHSKEDPRKLPCDKCDRKFITEHHLQQHLDRHKRRDNNPYKCRYCDKKFVHQSNQAQHEMIHIGIKKHECPKCKTKFLHGSHLRQHLLTHSGEKKFECSVCSKCFAHNGSLRKHMNVHGKKTGESLRDSDDCQEETPPLDE